MAVAVLRAAGGHRAATAPPQASRERTAPVMNARLEVHRQAGMRPVCHHLRGSGNGTACRRASWRRKGPSQKGFGGIRSGRGLAGSVFGLCGRGRAERVLSGMMQQSGLVRLRHGYTAAEAFRPVPGAPPVWPTAPGPAACQAASPWPDSPLTRALGGSASPRSVTLRYAPAPPCPDEGRGLPWWAFEGRNIRVSESGAARPLTESRVVPRGK